jgi:hypothetical protein
VMVARHGLYSMSLLLLDQVYAQPPLAEWQNQDAHPGVRLGCFRDEGCRRLEKGLTWVLPRRPKKSADGGIVGCPARREGHS